MNCLIAGHPGAREDYVVCLSDAGSDEESVLEDGVICRFSEEKEIAAYI